MGIYNVFSRVCFIFLSSFLWIILFLNMLTFAGLNPLGSPVAIEGSYFGFQSLLYALDDLPYDSPITIYVGSLGLVYDSIEEFTGSWDKLINSQDFWSAILNAITFIGSALVVWSYFWLHIFASIGSILVMFFDYFNWFVRLLGGYYNMDVPSYSSGTILVTSWIIQPNTSWQS